MSTNKTANKGDPSEQVSNIIKTVTAILHAAGGKTAEGSRLVTEKVMQQSEANTKKVFETLKAMAESRNPTEIATLYTDFVKGSAQMHAEQLMEMGQIMMRTNKEAWEPITQAIKSAATSAQSKPV